MFVSVEVIAVRVEDVFDQIGALREAANDWLSKERPCDLRVFSGFPLTLCLSKSRQLTLWFCSDRQKTSDFLLFFYLLPSSTQIS